MRIPAFFTDAKFEALHGMGLMVLATISFSVMHSIIKLVSTDIHPFEVAFFRNFFGLIALFPFFIKYGFSPLKTTRLGLHTIRVGLNICSMMAFFFAISITPLAEVITLSFAAPIFATILAIFFFKEIVNLSRWLAIILGFSGAIVILRPLYAEIGLGPILALLSAITWGAAVILIKILGRTDSSLTITAYMVLLLTPLSLIPALFVWQWPSLEQLGWLALIGCFGTVGHLSMNQAIKKAPTNVVMPIDFVRIVWGALIGYIVFAEVPDIFVWVGGAMICTSGLWIAQLENKKRRT